MNWLKTILGIVLFVLVLCQIGLSSTGPLLNVSTNDRSGYVDANGTWVMPPTFDEADAFHEGLATVKSNGVRQFIDVLGHVQGTVEPKPLFHLASLRGGFAEIHGVRGHSFVDAKGRLVNDKWFDETMSFSCGRAAVQIEKKWGFVDNDINLVISNRFDLVLPFSEGVAFVRVGKLWGIIDQDGCFSCPLKFFSVAGVGAKDGLSLVNLNGRWLFVNNHGEQKVPGTFEGGLPFQEGLALVILGGKYGYIDTKGDVVIGYQFKNACSFSEGFAAVESGEKWGYIDRSGKMVITPQFDEAGPFKNGFARVEVHFDIGYIDTLGQYVWTPSR